MPSKESLIKTAQVFQLASSYILHFTWLSRAEQHTLQLQKSRHGPAARRLSRLGGLHILELSRAIAASAQISFLLIMGNPALGLFTSRVTTVLLLPTKLRIGGSLGAPVT